MIDELAKAIPANLMKQSGKVFYSGRSAFSASSDIYILGYNPGGDPASAEEVTIQSHTEYVLQRAPALWSAYIDESWKGKTPGTFGIQPRVCHMFRALRRELREIPSSNLIFFRSRQANDISSQERELINMCWPFHQLALKLIRPRVIICLGIDVGEQVKGRLGADRQIDTFVENNNRGWTSTAHQNSEDLIVLSLSHPRRADWTTPNADPTPLVRRVLSRL